MAMTKTKTKTTTKIAYTFLFLVCIPCHAARGNDPSQHHLNVHSKSFLFNPPPTEFVYNEEKMREELAQSGTNSSSWDEFNVCITPQQGQKEANKIYRLPGQPKVNFHHYSGYVTVDDRAGRAFFYYFAESDENHFAKPLVLWLNGGPSCSSLIGAMMELGPFRVMSDGQTLAINLYAWNKVANVIFLDTPAGVGFSYSNDTSDYHSPGDRTTAQDSYTFLINWVERFPEYKNRDFYIAGESYAGHYAPQLAKLILQKNKKASPADIINLRGVVVGNGAIDDTSQNMGTMDFLYKHDIISKEVRDTLVACQLNPDSLGITSIAQCTAADDILSASMENLNMYAINAPVCNLLLNIPDPQQRKFDPCTEEYMITYLNTHRVQEALHAKFTQWKTCNKDLAWAEQEPTILLTIKELMASGLRVWLFSGDMDASVPVEGTEYALKALQLPVKTNPYTWYNAPNEVGGNVIEYVNLTFVTVKNSGHFVASYEPSKALTIFTSFLQGELPPAAN